MENSPKRTRVLIGSGAVLVLVVALVTALLVTARDHTSKGPKPISTTTTAPKSTTNPLPTSTTSTKVPPTPTAYTWSAPTKATQVNPSALTCPSVSLCVAAVGNDLFVSTDPRGVSPWKVELAPPGNHGFSAISCPTVSFCVAVGDLIYVSRDPAGGPKAWVSQGVPPQTLTSISCPSVTLCVAIDSGPYGLLTSASPTGGAKAWKLTVIPGQNYYLTSMMAISCPTVSLCVAVGNNGVAEVSTNPTGGPKAWTKTLIDPTGGDIKSEYPNTLSTIDCVGTNFCIAEDGSGGIVVTSDPTGGPSAWHLYTIPGMRPTEGISCSASSICVNGATVPASFSPFVMVGVNPLNGPSSWSVSPSANVIDAVSCPTASTCVSLSQDGTVQVGTAS